jgi:hypothetical protein
VAGSLHEQSRARRGLEQLHADLSAIVERDQEQEVRGIAVPTVSEAIRAAYDLLTEDRVAAVTVELFSAEVIAEGEPVRAVDALLVVGQLLAALGPEPARVNRSTRRVPRTVNPHGTSEPQRLEARCVPSRPTCPSSTTVRAHGSSRGR